MSNTTTESDEGLVCAYRFDGTGGGEVLPEWPSSGDTETGKVIWVHMERDDPGTREWLREKSGLRPLAQEALLADDTRPRCTSLDEGVLLNLRGVNLNPGAEPEDMVSIRLWLEPHRIVSCRIRRLMAVEDLQEAIQQSQGPHDTGGFVLMLADKLTTRIEPILDDLQDALDHLEDRVVTDTAREQRTELARLRHRTILLRRYIGPQREALRRLAGEDVSWLTSRQRERLTEIADRVTRYVEDLDVIRERATIINDELVNLLAERMERTMHLLSVVATVFLPLTLVSGMLGMNVGGIPGEKTEWAFTALCVGFVAVVAVEFWIVRRLKWI